MTAHHMKRAAHWKRLALRLLILIYRRQTYREALCLTHRDCDDTQT